MPIEAIVFDIDNTLVDFHTMKLACTQAGLDKMIERGMPITADEGKRIVPEVFRNYGWEDQLLFRHVAEFAGVRQEVELERYSQIGKIAYRRKQREFLQPYEGVSPTLEELKKRKIALAILSDAPRYKVFDRLCDTDLEPYFENNVVGAVDDSHKKPHPSAFETVLSLIGRKTPENVMMIGDHPVRDILGARNYGFVTAWAKYGYFAQQGENIESIQTRAHYVLERFNDILKKVEEHK